MKQLSKDLWLCTTASDIGLLYSGLSPLAVATVPVAGVFS